jgi:CheY-like chemotaxis protein/two-component sensor histidine kinase
LRHAKEAAEAANRAKDDFIASLSHELRSPLNPVLLLASEYARSPGLPAQMREDFQIILKNVRLQARLIDDLLDLTRIERGGISISARVLDLAVVLKEICESLKGEAEEKHIIIELHLPEQCCAVRGDSVRLQQIFGNILRNAIKFSQPHSQIRVNLVASACSARVSISDHGFGIRQSDLKRIFEPFTQGPRGDANAAGQGLGLGLSIAQRLVERHRGSIIAESSGLGKGATFHVDLPLEARALESTSAGLSEPANCTSPPSIRILLVDDHEATLNVLARMTRKLGYEVLVAADIRAAAEILFETEVDVLVSDLGLPDGDGTELAMRWKPRIKFGAIALSGFGMESDVLRSREGGFKYHLTKPVEFERLAQVIRSVCAGDSSAPLV